MKLSFTFQDVQEISSSAYVAFISTFRYTSDESNSESDSDLSDFDLDNFGCGEITPEVENMVENQWKSCRPLSEIFGTTTSELIKGRVRTATEESQCAGLKFFDYITPGEDRGLISTCTTVCYWCCCETIKKVSPIIAEATANLIY